MTEKEANIFYKVVDRETRLGSNWMLFIMRHNYHIYDMWIILRAYIFRFTHRKFFPVYKKGKTLTADFKSPGFMLFNTYDAAIRFINQYQLGNFANIIKVEALYPVYKVPNRFFISGCGDNPWKLRTIKTIDNQGVLFEEVYKQFNLTDNIISKYHFMDYDSVSSCHVIKVLT